jgi:phosphatidylserine/phosphatidylglycerophosphate/cardiolipin synthase-like enzyme
MSKRIKRFFEKVILLMVFGGTVFLGARIAHLVRDVTSKRAYAHDILVNSQGYIKKALFSPRDKVKNVLLGLIEAEEKEIYIATYTLTDQDIAQALLEAYERGVLIEIVADGKKIFEHYSKLGILCKKGIPLYSYPKDTKNMLEKDFYSSLMHNKFMIFGDSITHIPLIWTGSFNFTRTAAYNNRENVIVLQDVEIIESYKKEFQRLKDECICINKKQSSSQVSLLSALKLSTLKILKPAL